MSPTLWAVSDLHVGHRGNDGPLDAIRPRDPDDWLILAGDLAERVDDVVRVLELLAPRFARTIWVPGNHELWTPPRDGVQLRGEERYLHLVEICRDRGVLTPEDPYPLWTGPGGPVRIVPLFLLYDYTWLPAGTADAAEALEYASDRGVAATDEFMLHPDPYASRDEWGRARVADARRRLDALDPAESTVLVNHWPLVREPTHVLWYPEFALWCGTTATADWHLRYRAECCVYGHLHIPRTSWYDGVRFEECSVGYPREWKTRGLPDPLLRQILPDPGEVQVGWRRGADGEVELYGSSVRALDPERARELRDRRERLSSIRELRQERRRGRRRNEGAT